jgi:hypothetical protein
VLRYTAIGVFNRSPAGSWLTLAVDWRFLAARFSNERALASSERIFILFGPLSACAELGLDRVALDLLLGGDPRVNDGGLLLFCIRTHAGVTCIDFSEVAYAPTFPRVTY